MRQARRIGRRAFLAVAGALAPLARAWRLAGRFQAPAPIGVQQFIDLSSRLTHRTGLDPGVARRYLTALLAVPVNGPLLAQLARGDAPEADAAARAELERQIIAAWYTGVYRDGDTARLATYEGALMWQALRMPAPGTCRGETGFWARPPAVRE